MLIETAIIKIPNKDFINVQLVIIKCPLNLSIENAICI